MNVLSGTKAGRSALVVNLYGGSPTDAEEVWLLCVTG